MELWEIDQAIRALAPIDGVNSNGGISFAPEATQEQRAAAEAKMAELLPSLGAAAAPKWTWLQFIERFTEAEQLAIVTASMQSAPIKLWYDKAVGAEFIQADEPRTIAGMQALVDVGLISAERRDEILGT